MKRLSRIVPVIVPGFGFASGRSRHGAVGDQAAVPAGIARDDNRLAVPERGMRFVTQVIASHLAGSAAEPSLR